MISYKSRFMSMKIIEILVYFDLYKRRFMSVPEIENSYAGKGSRIEENLNLFIFIKTELCVILSSLFM